MHFHQFAKNCQRVLVDAARDLAVLTRMGIHAHEIVALAHKCEDLEKLLSSAPPQNCRHSRLQIRRLSRDLRKGITRICRTALRSPEISLRRETYHGIMHTWQQ